MPQCFRYNLAFRRRMRRIFSTTPPPSPYELRTRYETKSTHKQSADNVANRHIIHAVHVIRSQRPGTSTVGTKKVILNLKKNELILTVHNIGGGDGKKKSHNPRARVFVFLIYWWITQNKLKSIIFHCLFFRLFINF